MGPLCIRRDGLDRDYGNPNYSGVPGGPWPWRESYVGAQWASEHSFQLLNALNLSGYAATAPAPPSKGRLIRCTVPGSIPNCLAMQTPAASLAASNSGTGPVPVTINSGILASATEQPDRRHNSAPR